MSEWLEIVIPVRNPGDKLLESAGSLAAQSAKDFSVLFSDNFSNTGLEFLEKARGMLAGAGIAARIVKPPFELGRVEHWNWAHSQGRAAWLKPLFVGDLLGAEFVALLKERATATPAPHVARCEFDFKTGGQTSPAMRAPCESRRLSPAEFLRYFPRYGNWIGGPINIAYSRLAWQSTSGYSPELPSCADFNLYVAMILRHGVELLPERLVTFQLHTQRFSHGIQKRRVSGWFEVWLTLRQARNYCLSANLPWPRNGVRAGVWRQVKIDYWYPKKEAIKRLIGVGRR
jgi:hypothetical protein